VIERTRTPASNLRSAAGAGQYAASLLRASELAAAYEDARAERAESGDGELMDAVTADGLA
jgi:hypothetical protein